MMLEGRLRCFNSRRRSRSELIVASARQQHALIKDNSTVKQNYFDSNMIKKIKLTLMQCSTMDSFSADVNVYMPRHKSVLFNFVSGELSFIFTQ